MIERSLRDRTDQIFRKYIREDPGPRHKDIADAKNLVCTDSVFIGSNGIASVDSLLCPSRFYYIDDYGCSCSVLFSSREKECVHQLAVRMYKEAQSLI